MARANRGAAGCRSSLAGAADAAAFPPSSRSSKYAASPRHSVFKNAEACAAGSRIDFSANTAA